MRETWEQCFNCRSFREMSTKVQIQKKEKTKAKKRYLQRKKERRKVKQKANTTGHGASLSPDKDDEEKDEDEWEEEEADEAMVAKPPTKPPKKKRKLDLEDPYTSDAAPMDVDVDPAHGKSPTPSLVGALPSFPLPKHPDAPSKIDLALQGLDKSLVHAVVVGDGETQSLDDIGLRMSGRMKKRLKELGIVELFAVQKVLLPLLPSETTLYTPYDTPPDVCVSAPTGSGKTLAYAIPIIETLSKRIVTRLRALIVLPTRDLVAQVRETMESLSKGTNLRIGTVTGQHSFVNEQIGLVGNLESPDTGGLEGGSSRVDILICTPGRLIDHLEGTPNFTLQHLRFLERFVIDEADKLLAQSFQDWLSRVLAATRVPSTPSRLTLLPFPCSDALSPSHVPHSSWRLPSVQLEKPQSSTQKLLFSATITSDPGKLKGLGLRGPVKWVVVRGGKDQNGLDRKEVGVGGVLDVVMERFEVPSTLIEHYIITPTSLKPLVLFYLILKHDVANALVFTKSAESTERLMRLSELFFGGGLEPNATEGDEGKGLVVRAYSSDLSVSERKTVLDMFKSRKVHILISSDLISRGIDITHVGHVVSYDAPVDMRKYVHRVGRTARAGREGHAWCLVEEHEARHFKQMLLASDHLGGVKRMRVGEKELDGLRNKYNAALGKLRESYVGGQGGR